jgi:hypothetical protein
MPTETSKATTRRLTIPAFRDTYFVGTALDIGANVGAFTVAYAKRVGPTGRV